jgi:hypothetical protein
VGITLLKHEPSAQIPWQNTMLGFVSVDFDFISSPFSFQLHRLDKAEGASNVSFHTIVWRKARPDFAPPDNVIADPSSRLPVSGGSRAIRKLNVAWQVHTLTRHSKNLLLPPSVRC